MGLHREVLALAEASEVDALVAMLSDDDQRRREAAAVALGASGSSKAVEVLILTAFGSDPRTASAAAIGLSLTGSERAVEPLSHLLMACPLPRGTRNSAAVALEQLNAVDALQTVVRHPTTPAGNRRSAQRSVKRLSRHVSRS